MNPKEIIFSRPVAVFQVFRNINIYEKTEKSFDDRKDKSEWNKISSKSGHVINGELYLPEQIINNPDLVTCDLITIEDDNVPNPKGDYNRCLHLARNNKFDIFEIKKKDDIELHLKYGYFEVGIPRRENFKLGEIKRNKPIEIKINGKTDSSLTSRRARVYKEQAYIFEYIGDFDKCKILREPYDSTVKHVPAERKVIDLTKQLW